MIDTNTTVARSQELVATGLGNGELALLSVSNGKYFSASPLGRRIWEHLEAPKTVEEMQRLLLAEYDVPAAQCKSDLTTFLHQMLDARLLNVVV
jgi:hypothetical protein